ncbi:MAG: site-2 protease family protein [bacterium]|nr:site-2 protease family protein [bacterium]
MLGNLLIVFIAIGFVIFIHELGHFFFAKLFGVNVEKFSIGFGKEIFGLNRNKTRYSLAAFPLGGFIKMQGEHFNADFTKPEKGDFVELSYLKRIIVVAAGAIVNILFAIIFVFFMTYFIGINTPDIEDLRIAGLVKNRPAIAAGVQVDDVLMKIGVREIKSWEDVIDFSLNHDGELVVVEFLRDDQPLEFEILPFYDKAESRYLLGITGYTIHRNLLFSESLNFSYNFFKRLTRGFFSIFTFKKEVEVVGPIGVMKELTNALGIGFSHFLFLLAVVSFNLGLANLLPLPILDGGHIMIYLIEWISGRRMNKNFLDMMFTVMFIVLIVFMIFVTNKDVLRIFGN